MICVRHLYCLMALTLLLPACDQVPPADSLNEGQLFPALRLSGLDRPDTTIDELRGRWVVMNVWASWCGPCREELGSLQQLADTFSGRELIVIGLNVDEDIHVAREFMRDQSISFANYSDPDMFIARQLLGIRAFPDTFVIAPDGTLWRSISGELDWASERVREALRQAIAGRPEALTTL